MNLSDFLNNAPELCGDIARYVNSVLETDQPGISLATAISFVGALRSKRIRSPQGIAPSIYTCAIASTGIGKTRAQHVITDICTKADITSLLMGRPASDAGILKRLQTSPRQYLIWDEFGLALSEMSKSSSSYRVAILSCIMDLYSSAGRHHIGKEYAEKSRIDIASPFLSISAVSTPNRFYDALTQDFIEDGFLSRWLVFEGQASILFKEPSKEPIPNSILEKVIQINKGRERTEGGELQKILSPDDPMLRFESKYAVDGAKAHAQQRMINASSETERAFWSRSFENFIKLCMIFSDQDNYISDRYAIFCWDLVDFLVTRIIERCKVDIQAGSLQEKRHKKFVNLISVGSTLTQAELTKRALNHGFDKDERKRRIEDLIENEIWIQSVRKNSDTNRQITEYTRKS